MRWPSLVAPWACKTPVTVRLTNGTGEDGAPIELPPIEAFCSYSEKQKQTVDAQRRLVTLEGTMFFPGDLAPEVAILAGTVAVGEHTWTIYRASRGRNPDGTVNYTQLELM